MRKTYDLKQVKISTSILWLLNKADTRTVFFSSMDIFSNKVKLHLHSLIIRGLVSGELYCAALSKLFLPCSDRPIRAKDFHSILDFIIGMDTYQSAEVAVLQQKKRDTFIGNLTKLEPFELSEHLQIIDAMMSLYLGSSELVSSVPSILGKLCDYRPNIKDPKKLLEIWFKCMACLSLSKNNIKDTKHLIKSIIIQENLDSSEASFLDSIKFSDKVGLVMSYESDVLDIEQEFLFEYSADGLSSRENVKHNFITVIRVFRKNFPKVLEDFKELMLVLNSSHIQISSNLIINIDLFVLEFFIHLEELTNRGNRTFRKGSQISENKESMSRTFRIDQSNSNKEKIGVYNTVNKPIQLNDKNSKISTFGTYSGRKHSHLDSNITINSVYDEQPYNWASQKSGNNLLGSARKSSVPNGLNLTGVNKTNSLDQQYADGILKSQFLEKRNSIENNEKNDINKTSWLIQSEKSDRHIKRSLNEDSDDKKKDNQKFKVNETRLRLNLKRQEIEENRRQIQQKIAEERQLLSDIVFKDVTMGISQTGEDEIINYKPRRVSDMKRGRALQSKPDLLRSRSQDLSKSSVEDINISLNQLKSEISKLTSEQARLSAKISENKVESVEAFSPQLGRSTSSRDGVDSKATERESIRSMPTSWHPYNNHGNNEPYNNFNMGYVSHYPYPTENYSQKFHPTPLNFYPTYRYGFPPEINHYQLPPPTTSIPQSHYVTKSLRDNDNSRPTSPGAMSEPSKFIDQHAVVNESKPLTIQNLIKHNKSMEQLSKDIPYSDNNSNKSLIRNSSEKKVVDFVNDAVTESSSPSSLQRPINNIVNEPIKDIESLNKVETVLTTSYNQNRISNVVEPEVVIEENENSNIAKSFFVTFGEENSKKNIPKKLKSREFKDSSNKQPASLVTKNSVNVPKFESQPKVKIMEKPLAFVISVDDEKSIEINNDQTAFTRDKLLQLTEKREQERKEKLEKVREITRIENEKRLQKVFEKERIKEERKLKREAIYEAHLEKKLEKESGEAPNRKDVKSNKKPSRAVSAAPLIQRSEFHNDNYTEPTSPPDIHYPDPLISNFRRDRIPVVLPGMKLFVEPKTKSNKNVILNAIKYCCLAGKVNDALKLQTVEELERFDASHFMILMRGGCQYRSLYRFEVDSECLTKLSGMGPKRITNKMVEKFFKYNSGAKKFMEITSTNHLSTVIDGITIFNTLWKQNISTNCQLNSSETSSQAEHTSQ